MKQYPADVAEVPAKHAVDQVYNNLDETTVDASLEVLFDTLVVAFGGLDAPACPRRAVRSACGGREERPSGVQRRPRLRLSLRWSTPLLSMLSTTTTPMTRCRCTQRASYFRSCSPISRSTATTVRAGSSSQRLPSGHHRRPALWLATTRPVPRRRPRDVQGPFAKEYNADNPAIGTFLNRGGKLLIWHGWSDPRTQPDGHDRILRTGAPRCAVRSRGGAPVSRTGRLSLRRRPGCGSHRPARGA